LIPDALVALWRRLAAPPVPAASPPAHRAPPPGRSVIDAFNARFTVTDILGEHGYRVPRRGKGRRLVAPTSESRVPGCVVLASGKVYSHHAADPLAGPHAHDAFSAYATLQHGGDVRAAVKAAAGLLGLDRDAPELSALDRRTLARARGKA
jgi:putative DNA primase/helicase